MTAQTANKATVPVGSDGWNLTTHIKQAIETTRSIIPVATQAERDGLASLFPGSVLPVPTFVWRTDLMILETWTGTRWLTRPHSEWTFAATGIPSATVWGASVMTNDSGNTTDSAFVTTPGTDRLTIRDAGIYSVEVSAQFGTAGNGRSFMQIANGATSVKRTSTTGEDTSGVGIANFKCAANTTLTFSAYITLASGTTTWGGRIRVTKIG